MPSVRGNHCGPTRHDCEPRINTVGSGADNVGRTHVPDSLNVSQAGCSSAGRASK
jgi:hypothetical protein